MKKNLFFATILLFGFAACNNPKTYEGVVINDVRWATRNVCAPSTFAQNPEDAGMFFQWNRRKGWNNVGEDTPTDWDSAPAEGTAWYAANDPCPEGWRVPTREELMSLNSAEGVWTTQNGVNGRLFGTYPHQIFLPAVGRRHIDGTLYFVEREGFYWSTGTSTASRLRFRADYNGIRDLSPAYGFSVRCVAK